MALHKPRLIAGVYQVGQVITTVPPLVSYSAYNRNTNDVVGLLVIDLPPAFDPQTALQAFAPLDERRKVQSQHVISVFSWGIAEHAAYIVTDPPRGITLRQLMNTENVDLARSLDLTRQMTRGMVALQSKRLTDVDLRPQLITVDTIGTSDRVQIDDVGLRSLYRQFGYLSGQNSLDVGYLDPRYLAPEHFWQGPGGPASDVYALGLVLFELVTGRPPFVGRTPAETAILQSQSPVPRMAQFKHETPPALQHIVERALAKDPRQRYANALALLTALESLSLAAPGAKKPAQVEESSRPEKSVDPTTEMPSMAAPSRIEAFETMIINKEMLREHADSKHFVSDDTGVYAYLDLERANLPPERIPLTHAYTIIGRVDPKRGITPEVDLSAFDPEATVSRQHARIRFEKTFFYIEDLKSRNKTRLGELTLTPLKPELLQHGDTIYCGSLKLIFKIPGMPDQPQPAHLP